MDVLMNTTAGAFKSVAVTLVAALAAFIFAFGQYNAQAGERVLRVAAASSLTGAMKELSAGFEKKTGRRVLVSLGSSGMLTEQIKKGAPFDLFFSANRRYTDELKEAGRVVGPTEVVYARGALALVVNASSGVEVRELKDLLKPEIRRVALANPAHAPYGVAALEALNRAGLWDALKSRVVYGENIRQTVQFVQSGNATAALVALSVAGARGITSTLVPADLYSPIDQTAAVVKSSANEKAARVFLDYVTGPEGRAVLKSYGFITPEEF